MSNNGKRYIICCFISFVIFVVIFYGHIVEFIEIFEKSKSTFIEFNSRKSKDCLVPEWNRITLPDVPDSERFKKWASLGVGTFRYIQNAQVRLLSAYVYHDQISIVTTSENIDNKLVKCLYYDCKRCEIPNSSFATIVVPMAIITCPRRYGAEFVSIRFDEKEPPHEPIPLTYRIYNEPIHELSVCVGPLYGNSSKWLEIIEYVEHFKLMGVSYFYFTLFNINEYDRKIVDYYSKFGYAEYTTYVTEYQKLGWLFHMIQIQECHHRSRYHSKWVMNIDIDERFVYTESGDLIQFLRSMPSFIGELSFTANRIIKTGQIPDELQDFTSLQSELTFLKYNKTTEISWFNFKSIVRPELVYFLFYHWSYRQQQNVHIASVPKRIGHFRHYRTIDQSLNGNWFKFYNGTLKETRLAPDFERQLSENVKEKVKYVYDQNWLQCEGIDKWIFKRFSRFVLDCKKNE